MWTRRPFEAGLILAAVFTTAGARGAPPEGPAVADADDPLAAYRDRFKLGMEQYRAGSLANAIGYWEPVYAELGAEKGYRLAYDLGVVYAELGDATRAAERLQSFLDDVDRRLRRGESLDAIVTKEATDARSRIDGLLATKARLRVDAGSPPITVKIDANDPRLAGFVAWVSPGEHTVTFGPGTPNAETRTVHASAGDVVDLVPASPAAVAPSPLPSAPAPPVAAVEEPKAAPGPAALRPPPILTDIGARPFSPAVLLVSGGLAAAAGVTAVPLESHAAALRTRYASEEKSDGVIPQGNRASYDDARTWAYTAVGSAVGLGVVTGALATWYFFGASRHEVLVEPSVTREHGGASVGVRVRF